MQVPLKNLIHSHGATAGAFDAAPALCSFIS
jgi:hypothetical protein